jgi:cell division septum initiation protein DivIVA
VDETKVYTSQNGTSYTRKNKHLCYNSIGLKNDLDALRSAKQKNDHLYVKYAPGLIKAHFEPKGTLTTAYHPYTSKLNNRDVQYVYHVISPDYSNNPAMIELILKNLFEWSDEQLVNTDLEAKRTAVLKGLEGLIATTQAQINAQAEQQATTKTTQAPKSVTTDEQNLAGLQENVAKLAHDLTNKEGSFEKLILEDIEQYLATIIVYHPNLITEQNEITNAETLLSKFDGYTQAETDHGPATGYFQKNGEYRPGEDANVMERLTSERLAQFEENIRNYLDSAADELTKFETQLNSIQKNNLRLKQTINSLHRELAQKRYTAGQAIKRLTNLKNAADQLVKLQKQIIQSGNGIIICTYNTDGTISLKLEQGVDTAIAVVPAAPAERKRDIAWRWAKRAGITAGAAAALLVAMSAERV